MPYSRKETAQCRNHFDAIVRKCVEASIRYSCNYLSSNPTYVTTIHQHYITMSDRQTYRQITFSGIAALCSSWMCTEGDGESAYGDYGYNSVERDSSITSLSHQSSSSSSSSAAAASAAEADIGRQWQLGRHGGSASSWRWCYVCSGKTPDRQCELFPQHVTLGPAKVNCTKNYCTAYVRYRPKDYAVGRDRSGKPGIWSCILICLIVIAVSVCHRAGMLRPRGLCGLEAKLFGLGLGLVVSGLGLGLGLVASGLGLVPNSDDTLAGFPAPVSSACFWR